MVLESLKVAHLRNTSNCSIFHFSRIKVQVCHEPYFNFFLFFIFVSWLELDGEDDHAGEAAQTPGQKRAAEFETMLQQAEEAGSDEKIAANTELKATAEQKIAALKNKAGEDITAEAEQAQEAIDAYAAAVKKDDEAEVPSSSQINQVFPTKVLSKFRSQVNLG